MLCPQSISLNDDAIQFASKSIHLEKCVVFRLDVPGRRVMAVRARVTRTLCDIVSPILTRAGLSWNDVVVHVVRDASYFVRLCKFALK